MENQKISVIVPIYNVEEYVARCIQSICNQTCHDMEIILVDDGSTDKSGKICDDYAACDTRIKVIHKANEGVVSARQIGLEHACGAYVGFVDGDDYVEPNLYFELRKLIQQENADFVHSGYYTDEMPSVYGTAQAGSFQIGPGETVQYLRKFVVDPVGAWKMAPSVWSKLFRKDLIKEAHQKVPNDISYGEDLLCLCHCIMKSKRISISNGAYYHYVTRNDSVCNKKNIRKIEKEYRLYEALCDLFHQYGIYDALHRDLERFYLYSIANCVRHLGRSVCQLYQYPSPQDLVGKRVVLYGIGEVGQDYYTQLRRDTRCEVVAVADARHRDYQYGFMNLIAPQEIFEYSYDVVVIAVLYEESASSIKRWLLEKGAREENILWKKPGLAIRWGT